MGDIGTQHHIAVETDSNEYGIDSEMLLESFTGREAISELYNFQLKVLCAKLDIDPTGIVGKKLSFSVAYSDGSKKRVFNGYIKRIKAGNIFTSTGGLAQDSRLRRYELEVVPWMWFLTQTRDSRVFQDKSVIEIIEEVLADHQVTSEGNFDVATHIVKNHPKRNICIQYQETDFDFISRLMEEEGIFYYFRHAVEDSGDGTHTLVLCDDVSGYKFNPDKASGDDNANEILYRQGAGPGEQISLWQHQFDVKTGAVLLHDYDYNLATANPPNIPQPSPTQLGSNFPAVQDKTETYEYPGKYHYLTEGESASTYKDDLTQVRAEEIEAGYDLVNAKSNNRSIHPCGKFTTAIDDSDWESTGVYDDGYVVRAVTHYAVDTSYFSGNQNTVGMKAATAINQIASAAMAKDASQDSLIEVMKHLADALANPDPEDEINDSSSAQYHNTFEAMPASVVFRPRRRTPKPRIPGPQTAIVIGSGEIDTDEQGRVKVKFHWEREDRESETWVRVSQMWAGKAWGGQHIPHVGHEVLVSFLQGDPDLPVVTGRVYNNYQNTPLSLPGEKTKSIIRDYGSNEMIWEGAADVQHMWFHQACDNEIWMEGKPGEETIRAKQACGNELSMVATEPSINLKQECGNELYMTASGTKIQLHQACGNELLMEESGGKITIRNPSGQNSIVMDQSAQSITMHSMMNDAQITLGGSKGISMTNQNEIFKHSFGNEVKITGGLQEASYLGAKNSNTVGVDTSQHLSYAESKNIGNRLRLSKRAMTYSAKDALSLKGGASDDGTIVLDGAGVEAKAGDTKLGMITDGDVIIETSKKLMIEASTKTQVTSDAVVLDAKNIDLKNATVKHKNLTILP
ncbi:MAG: type VI secretion system tip protein TssI/VgrG [Ketobacteraceae bacterium]|nr:type VI secretion system tip protein TssI/VgrG [Ketobacteraceae bacterium]